MIQNNTLELLSKLPNHLKHRAIKRLEKDNNIHLGRNTREYIMKHNRL